MTTSPNPSTPTTATGLAPAAEAGPGRVALRLALRSPDLPEPPGALRDGAWWPQSRDLQTEAAELVDQFPSAVGRVNRLLFSRPDWDDGVVGGRGLRRIQTRRGPVKVGSFPADDTHEMVLSMASGARLRLLVVPWDTGETEARNLMSLDRDQG